MLIQRAAMPHSVFRSLDPMIALGAGGVPEPNFDRYASPWTCFADAGAGGDGDGGTGGAGGAGDAGAGGKPDKTFTQAELNAILAREKRSAEERAAKTHSEAAAKLQAELEELRAKYEDSNKSAAEKAAAAAARERAAVEAKLAETNKALAERDALLTRHQQELRDTKLNHELNALFGARKVLPEAMRAATLVFRADAAIEYDAEGKVVGVDVGSKRFGTVAEALDDWMKSNGAIYVAAPAGGAGTRQGNGSPSKPFYQQSTEDNIAAANAQRAARRS